MTASLITGTPDISRQGFLTLIDGVLPLIQHSAIYLGGTTPCATRPGDAPEKIDRTARFLMQTEGQLDFAISASGERVDVSLSPGQCVYLVPNAWWIEFRVRFGRTFGIVLGSDHIRLIQLLYPPPPPGGLGTPWAYHTALPLSGAGLMVSRALNLLAEEGTEEGAGELLASLLVLVRRHLRDDAPGGGTLGRAAQTWRAVRAYLDENYSRPLTRQSVGAALELNPNYISNLARRVTGLSFHQTLESVRVDQAKRLLRETDLKLHRIALLCGYADAPSFVKAFRRVTGETPGRFRCQR